MHRLLHVVADPGWKRDFENPDAEQWFERMNKIHIKSIWLSWNALCGEHRVQKVLTPESILWCVNRPNRWRLWLAVLLSWERQRASSDARFVHEIQWDTSYWNTNTKSLFLLQWQNVGNRSYGDDSRWIDLGHHLLTIYKKVSMKKTTDWMMRPVIMCLDVLEVCRVFKCSVVPVELLRPSIYRFCG